MAALAALDVGDLATADTVLAAHSHSAFDPRSTMLFRIAHVQRRMLGGDVISALDRTSMLSWARTGEPDLDLLMLVCRGSARLRPGDTAGAINDLTAALELATSLGHDETVLWTLSQLSGATGSACDFPGMQHWSNRAIEFARPRGWARSPRLAYAYLLAAWTGFQTGEIDSQSLYAQLAEEALGRHPNVEVELGVRSMAALAAFESSTGFGRYEAATHFHDLWQAPAAREVSPAPTGFAVPQEVRLALSIGELTWARDAAARVAGRFPGSAEALVLAAEVLAARGKNREALTILRRLRQDDVPVHVRTTLVAADVLAARLILAAGNRHGSLSRLIDAFDWADQRGFRRPFLDAGAWLAELIATSTGEFGRHERFAAQILQSLTDSDDSAGRPTSIVSPLTRRETEILRDLPSQRYFDQIAQDYGVSVNTVKTHVASIYRKLGVTGRREAVLEARRIGLL